MPYPKQFLMVKHAEGRIVSIASSLSIDPLYRRLFSRKKIHDKFRNLNYVHSGDSLGPRFELYS